MKMDKLELVLRDTRISFDKTRELTIRLVFRLKNPQLKFQTC